MRKVNSLGQYFALSLSFVFIVSAIGINIIDVFAFDNSYEINYEYINIKDMAPAGIAKKSTESARGSENEKKSMEVEMSPITSVDLPVKKDSAALVANRQVWYLPTEIGRITQNPHYGHVALDITSSRGMGETIHPVANGVVSGIYTDNAGALIVTVLHVINGQKYTSQYVHLSRYADGLYVGKQVTVNDALGQMGTTGNSTGVHLHIALLDCALFDSNDNNCKDLNGWYRYGQIRLDQGFLGLGSMMNVPGEWYNR